MAVPRGGQTTAAAPAVAVALDGVWASRLPLAEKRRAIARLLASVALGQQASGHETGTLETYEEALVELGGGSKVSVQEGKARLRSMGDYGVKSAARLGKLSKQRNGHAHPDAALPRDIRQFLRDTTLNEEGSAPESVPSEPEAEVGAGAARAGADDQPGRKGADPVGVRNEPVIQEDEQAKAVKAMQPGNQFGQDQKGHYVGAEAPNPIEHGTSEDALPCNQFGMDQRDRGAGAEAPNPIEQVAVSNEFFERLPPGTAKDFDDFPVITDGKRRAAVNGRVLGSVVKWKGKIGWLVSDEPIAHPEASMKGGKIYFAQDDVSEVISGVGAHVSVYVYADGAGLGAMNVVPSDSATAKDKLVKGKSAVKDEETLEEEESSFCEEAEEGRAAPSLSAPVESASLRGDAATKARLAMVAGESSDDRVKARQVIEQGQKEAAAVDLARDLWRPGWRDDEHGDMHENRPDNQKWTKPGRNRRKAKCTPG